MFVPIAGERSSNTALKLSQKFNTKKNPLHLFHKKYIYIYIKIWGFKNSPVVASFRNILPFSTSLVWFGLSHHVYI
jgi:hypothetical protein